MDTDAPEEQIAQSKKKAPTKSRHFFSDRLSRIFDRCKDPVQEESPQAEVPLSVPLYVPQQGDYLGLLQIMTKGPDCFAGVTVDEYLTLTAGIDPGILAELQEQAGVLYRVLTPLDPDVPAEPLPEPAVPMDASCSVWISADGMLASAYLFPPVLGGAEISPETISRALEAKGVTVGLQQDQLRRMSDERLYFQILPVAKGIAPVDGADGRVLDLIPREKKANYQVQEDGTVDYREVNRLQHIHSGDIICEISSPTDPVSGSTVDNRVLEGRPGKAPVIPSGKNTQLNSDGTCLSATIDGQVTFLNGKFNVDSVYTVSGDVDSSVGNLDVVGNVVIKGDVLVGFSVRATANISVSGIVEDAKLASGGNIQLNRGMNGNQHGIIRAKGDVVAQFLENCTVHTHCNLHAQSIVNCIVSCDGAIDASKGRGIIIGGTVTAGKSIEAKIIGNASHRTTELVLGSTPEFLQQQSKLDDEVRALQAELEETEKNLAYLERSSGLVSSQQVKYTQYKLRRSVITIQLAKKGKDLEDMNHRLCDMDGCFILSPVIYPGTRVTIGLETRVIAETLHRCRMYIGPDGIVMGSM